jgi:hypothetical protein
VQPIIPAPGPNGPWRVFILDRDPADPKWILATVATPGDIRPARPGCHGGRGDRGMGGVGDRPVPSRAHTPARRAVLARRRNR